MRKLIKGVVPISLGITSVVLAVPVTASSLSGINENLGLVSGSVTSIPDSVPAQLAELPGFSKPIKPNGEELNRGGGNVYPATATPFGYSLERMAALLAHFTTSANDLSRLPQTPFQILYIQDFKTNTGAFKVKPGTVLFVPLGIIDNSPPIIGQFPADTASRDAVIKYMFDQDQVGTIYEIIVNGRSTVINKNNSRYVAGPVVTPGLLDGGGDRTIQIGVFLTPFKKGKHTVVGRVTYSGKAFAEVAPAYGISPDDLPVTFGFSYTVEVE